MKYSSDDVRRDEQLRVLVCAYACLQDPGSQFPGGGDLMAWNIVRRLSEKCHLWVLTSSLNRKAIEKALENQPRGNLHFQYVRLPNCIRFLTKFPAGVQLYAYLWQWRSYFVARRLHGQIGFDAFHHLTYENDWMASLIGALLPVPYLRGPGGGAHRTPRQFSRRYPLRGRWWERLRAAGQWIFRHDPFFILGQHRAKALLVCNQEALDSIPRKWRHKATLFPVNGVAREAFREDVHSPCPGGRFRIVTAGRLIRLKAFDLAIRAFAQFIEQTKATPSSNEFTLTIFGEGPERKHLEALARELGLDRMIRFPGWKPRDELWEQIRSCDVFLFTSLRDGGGLVVVEALAAGKPVVCIDLGGPAIHVTPQCGIKVKPKEPEQVISDLASGLERLYRDPGLRRKMGSAARKRAEQFYLWDAISERMLAIYQQAFGKTREHNASFRPAGKTCDTHVPAPTA